MRNFFQPLVVLPSRVIALAFFGVGLGVDGCNCAEEVGPPPIVERDAGPSPFCRGLSGSGVTCAGDEAIFCDSQGRIKRRQRCSSEAKVCAEGFGCLRCVPLSLGCDGDTLVRCAADGMGTTVVEPCDRKRGLRCSARGCLDLCAEARAQKSYVGCEYVAVTAANDSLDPAFEFAVAVANPQLVPAEVVVKRGSREVNRATVLPNQMVVLRLPWVDELRRPRSPRSNRFETTRLEDGAYRIESDVPVTVHQYNPLEFRLMRPCIEPSPDGAQGELCHSYTNDSSLLLPITSLDRYYFVVSRPTLLVRKGDRVLGSPGFVVVINVEAKANRVIFRSRARTAPSADGRFPALMPGESFEFTLQGGEVIQILSAVPEDCPLPWEAEKHSNEIAYCPLGRDWDLTGSEVVADGKIAVFSGHNCAFVPYNRWACDHLEEQIPPAESLGNAFVASIGHRLRPEPNLLRILGIRDNTRVMLQPSPQGDGTYTLNRGEFVEVEIWRPTSIQASFSVLASRFFVGQGYAGLRSGGTAAPGDPAMAILAPEEQWRKHYVFLIPPTYAQSFIDLVGPPHGIISIDGRPLSTLQPIEGTGRSTITLPLAAGVHEIRSDYPVGLYVYGFGSYTSHLTLGGLDLQPVVDLL
ncbi:MAG: IgGFc-binding protein [Sandaracinaceae bacterium]|nr:IgGFc-binding protein [Sandaracinaceae bacterium]